MTTRGVIPVTCDWCVISITRRSHIRGYRVQAEMLGGGEGDGAGFLSGDAAASHSFPATVGRTWCRCWRFAVNQPWLLPPCFILATDCRALALATVDSERQLTSAATVDSERQQTSAGHALSPGKTLVAGRSDVGRAAG